MKKNIIIVLALLISSSAYALNVYLDGVRSSGSEALEVRLNGVLINDGITPPSPGYLVDGIGYLVDGAGNNLGDGV